MIDCESTDQKIPQYLSRRETESGQLDLLNSPKMAKFSGEGACLCYNLCLWSERAVRHLWTLPHTLAEGTRACYSPLTAEDSLGKT